MPLTADRIKETSTTTGTDPITLSGPVAGFRSFANVFATGDKVQYCIETQTAGDWEVGYGIFSGTLSRDIVLSSSNSNNLVSFSAGSKNVFATLSARQHLYIEDRGGQLYNIKSYGASGIGDSDETSLVQAAINAAELTSGTVYIPPGTYNVENLLIDSPNVRILGAGGAILKKLSDTTSPFRILKIDAPDVLVEGVIFDDTLGGANSNCIGVFGSAKRCVIKGNKFIDPHTGGVFAVGAVGDLLIANNHFDGSGYGFLTQSTANPSGISFIDNICDGGTQGDAFALNTPTSGAYDIVVRGNIIRGYQSTSANAGFGVSIANASGVVIVGNTIRNIKNEGIHLEKSNSVVVGGNFITKTEKSAIVTNSVTAIKMHNVTIESNIIVECATAVSTGAAGIALQSTSGFRNFVVAGNIIRDCGNAASASAYGISSQTDGTDIIIRHNIITNTAGLSNAGIRISKSTSCVLIENQCCNNNGNSQQYGLEIVGQQSGLQVANNDFTRNASGAMLTTGTGLVINTYGLYDPGHFNAFIGSNTYISGYVTAAKGGNLSKKTVQQMVFDPSTNIVIGDGKGYIHVPPTLDGLNLVYAHARVLQTGATNTTDIQIARDRAGSVVDMLATKLTIDSQESGTHQSATTYVISGANAGVLENDLIRVDIDAVSTNPPKGLILTLGFE